MGFLKASLDFCEQFLLNKFLLKLGQKISSKFLLQLSIIVEFIIFAIFSISSTHFWQQFPFNFFAKIATTICYQFLATVFSPRHKGVLLKTLLKGWNVTKDLSVTNSHWSFQCQRVGLKPRFHMGTLRLTSGWSRPSDKGVGEGAVIQTLMWCGGRALWVPPLDPPLLTHAPLNHGKLKYFPLLPGLPTWSACDWVYSTISSYPLTDIKLFSFR